MALGAFVAGLLLAETEFRKAIEATIEPFKGLLLGLFFFTVGMNIDFRELAREPVLLLACGRRPDRPQGHSSVGLARLFRRAAAAAFETGLLLGPGGEFAFVVHRPGDRGSGSSPPRPPASRSRSRPSPWR